jgi:hypothetical protein
LTIALVTQTLKSTASSEQEEVEEEEKAGKIDGNN